MDAAQSLQDALVEILSGLELTSALADRRLLLTLVSDACPGFPDLAENPVGRLHIIEIVRACVRQPAALWALSRALETMAPRDVLVARARRLIELATVVDLTSAESRRVVHGLLAGVDTGGKAGDVRRWWYLAAGPWAPVPATPVATLVAAFDQLASVNARPGGLPPALAFVEYVAAEAGPAGRRLREWAESEAARIGVVDQLWAVREEASAGPEPDHGPPCLVVQLSPDGISPDYVLSHWIQHRAGPWEPERGQDQLVPLARVGSTVDLLVDRAEVLWKSQRGPVFVEFVLPIDLLNRALEWEPRHLQIPRPIPLCLQYPVVLRSLERMRAQAWHRVWHNRWAAMAEAGQVRLHHGATDRDVGLDGWTSALLSDEGVASVALRTAPDAGMGRDELSLALTFGIPVMFWDRRGEPADDLGAAITTLVEGDPASLPQRVMRLRHEAMANSDLNSHIGRHLAVLWDDPTRLVDTGGSG
jgi:hypothetical protein